MMYDQSILGLGVVSESSKHASCCFTSMHVLEWVMIRERDSGIRKYERREGKRRASGEQEPAQEVKDGGSSLISP